MKSIGFTLFQSIVKKVIIIAKEIKNKTATKKYAVFFVESPFTPYFLR